MHTEINPMTSFFILLDSSKLQADCSNVFFTDEFVLFEYQGVHVLLMAWKLYYV